MSTFEDIDQDAVAYRWAIQVQVEKREEESAFL